MRHHLFGDASSCPVALLMKGSAFNRMDLIDNYLKPWEGMGIPQEQVVAFTLEYDAKKVTTAYAKEYLADLMPELQAMGVEYLYCADSNYFKLLTQQQSADPHQGYVMPCKWKGYEHMKVVLGLNYQQLIYKPELKEKLLSSLQVLASDKQGTYQAPGSNIIHKAIYPDTLQAIQETLEGLMSYPALTCDIEAFSLRFNEAGIGTISFAIDKHRGVAFACDYKPNVAQVPLVEKRVEYGRYVPNMAVRALIKDFFVRYPGKIIFQNAGYDAKVIIYVLWMKSLLDTAGLLEGLHVMYRDLEDTKIIAYLATNSTSGNNLGLKHMAQEFAGNWAVEDIKDIKLIPLKDLLQYNLVDALSTWYVKDKYTPVMLEDNQEHIYRTMMLPSQKLITQIELVGMPMNKARITRVERKLKVIAGRHTKTILSFPIVQQYEDEKTENDWEDDYQTRKAKAKNPDKILRKDRATFPQHVFNPGSPVQLQTLLYGMLGLPVIDKTDTKQPATGEKTLKKLLNHPIGQANKELLESLISVSQVSTILSTFIPAFKRAIDKAGDGIVWLHGSFNIGGTVSGRLSSSDPNLQNIPAKSIFAKLIKECFMAPKGWLFCGADFNSLEDMISALTTKDPNKIAVYTKGFDGHALRAAYYYRDELIEEGLIIDVTDPASVNQLKKLDHWARQGSKAPTFLLTYGGTYHGMMKNLGWTEEKSKRIENNYHTLYKVSDEYVASRLDQASKDGYVEVAFGLRLRTPLLSQVMYGNGSRIPYEAQAEGRTAGNALGQSYGLLNNRAMVAFMEKVWASPYRYDILPCSLIHDAGYLLIRDDPAVVEWANKHYIQEMRWQDLPEIDHPTVKLGAALDIFWPSWANPITIPNDVDQATIVQLCKEAVINYQTKKSKP